MSDISKAIWKLRPDSEFSFTDDDYSTIKWDKLEGNEPSKSEIDAAIKEIAKETKAAETQAVIDKAALLAKLGITADEFKQLLV